MALCQGFPIQCSNITDCEFCNQHGGCTFFDQSGEFSDGRCPQEDDDQGDGNDNGPIPELTIIDGLAPENFTTITTSGTNSRPANDRDETPTADSGASTIFDPLHRIENFIMCGFVVAFSYLWTLA